MKTAVFKSLLISLKMFLGINFIEKVYPVTKTYLRKFLRKKELKSLKVICSVWLENAFKNEAVDQIRYVKNSIIKK